MLFEFSFRTLFKSIENNCISEIQLSQISSVDSSAFKLVDSIAYLSEIGCMAYCSKSSCIIAENKVTSAEEI